MNQSEIGSGWFLSSPRWVSKSNREFWKVDQNIMKILMKMRKRFNNAGLTETLISKE